MNPPRLARLLCALMGHRDAIPIWRDPDGLIVVSRLAVPTAAVTELLCGRCLSTRRCPQ